MSHAAPHDRYGRTTSPRRRRIVVASTVSAIAVAAIAWFVWANPLDVGPHAVAKDTGYVMEGDKVTVMFDVSISPDHAAACAVQALGKSFAVVGWKVVTFPATSVETHSEKVTLRVTSPAVTGLVSSCWLT